MVHQSGGGREARAMRKAAELDGGGGENTFGRERSLRSEDRRSVHGEDPSAMAPDARTDSQRRGWRFASDCGSLQLLQSRSGKRKKPAGVGWRRAAGYRGRSGYDAAVYLWRSARERVGTDAT